MWLQQKHKQWYIRSVTVKANKLTSEEKLYNWRLYRIFNLAGRKPLSEIYSIFLQWLKKNHCIAELCSRLTTINGQRLLQLIPKGANHWHSSRAFGLIMCNKIKKGIWSEFRSVAAVIFMSLCSIAQLLEIEDKLRKAGHINSEEELMEFRNGVATADDLDKYTGLFLDRKSWTMSTWLHKIKLWQNLFKAYKTPRD